MHNLSKTFGLSGNLCFPATNHTQSLTRKQSGKFTMPLLLLLAICFFGLPVQAKYGGGTGEPNDPYLILDANQMNMIGTDSNDWDKHFKLMADIDLGGYTGTEFNVIGKFFDPFIGVFDGNNHTVHNFSWSAPGYVRGIGLFGVVGVVEDDGQIRGEIRNLHIVNVDVNITSCRFIGALVGFNDGRINNCSSSGEVLVGQIGGDIIGERTGGLVGYNDYGIIENCYSDGIVSGTYDIGGLVGINHRGVIRSSYSLCQVTGDSPIGGLAGDNCGIIDKCSSGGIVSGNWGVGGLIGHNNPYSDIGVIKNSFSYAEVYGTEQVGGLVGYNSGHSELREDIINCYAVGNVSGNINVGGLAGYNDHAKIVNCYSAGIVDGNDFVGSLVGDYDGGSYITCFWDIDVNPDVNGIGDASDPNVIGKTTTEMQDPNTYIEAGWDFVGESANGTEDIWTICEGVDYPRLQWEKYGGGTGESGNPYLIYTSCQMNAIGADSNDWDKHFKLMADIDSGGYVGEQFNIIGIDYDNPFTGVFDGNGHAILNFNFTSTARDYIGLFGCIRGPAKIEALGLIDPNVDAGTGERIGSLVGYNYGTVINCYSEGGSVSGSGRIGGLVGLNVGTVHNSYAGTSASGTSDYVGGLTGYNGGTILSCASSGSVETDANCVGGLTGYSDWIISESYATGSVSGRDMVGGLVGCKK